MQHARLALALAATASALACTGTLDGAGNPRPGKQPTPADPGDPKVTPPGGGGNGGTPGPVTPTTCKADEVGLSPLRRLTHVQYDNTIRDLLGVPMSLSKDFSDDELVGNFPGNYFAPISESQFDQYTTAANAAASKAVERLPQLLPCAAGVTAASENDCASTFIRNFGRRAYRRPLASDELDRYSELFKAGRTGGDFASGIELVVQGMLQSPHFLYLVEGPGPLTQHQLAARLSYFLWNAPPDPELAALADAGNLRTVETLHQQAQRLLSDARAKDMIADFHARWLDLADLESASRDPAVYGAWESMRPSMREEPARFANYVIGEGDGKLETLLTAPFTIADATLAKHYGATAPASGWGKVMLDRSQRGGVLTEAAFLTAHGQEGSAPIFRGIAVREQMFCVDLPPPPPGVDNALPAPKPTQTTRARLEEHRKRADCASCHSLMDTLGYGFEAYDGIGRFRTMENGVAVDNTGELQDSDVDGAFHGAIELGQRLVASKQVHECLATNWFRYALGRMETKLDACSIGAVSAKFEASELRIPDLLLALVESDAFRVRREETNP